MQHLFTIKALEGNGDPIQSPSILSCIMLEKKSFIKHFPSLDYFNHIDFMAFLYFYIFCFKNLNEIVQVCKAIKIPGI